MRIQGPANRSFGHLSLRPDLTPNLEEVRMRFPSEALSSSKGHHPVVSCAPIDDVSAICSKSAAYGMKRITTPSEVFALHHCINPNAPKPCTCMAMLGHQTSSTASVRLSPAA